MGSCSSRRRIDQRTQFPSPIQNSKSKSYSNSTLNLKSNSNTDAFRPTRNDNLLESVDGSALERIVEEADFTPIINAAIKLDTTTSNSSTKIISTTTTLHQKEKNDISWEEKYFFNVKSTDIVADVQNQTHSYISSKVSEDIDIYVSILHEISKQADDITQQRLSNISSKEAEILNKLVQERQQIINQIITKGQKAIDKSEEHYRNQIREFISKLEVDMSKQLNALQTKMETEKEMVLASAHDSMQQLSRKVQETKNNLFQLIEYATIEKRQEVFDKINALALDRTRQPIAYEHLRKLGLEIYSTGSIGNDEGGADNIPNRDKHIKDIKDSKPNQQPKRTAYFTSNSDQMTKS